MSSSDDVQYRAIVDALDDGFCIVEMIDDERGIAVDFRYLEVNQAFEKQSGLVGVTGRKGTECIPSLEAFWLERFDHVARTGEPARITRYATALDRWFDVYVFRPRDDQRRVAILFKDVSSREAAAESLRHAARASAFSVALADALRDVGDPVEAQAVAARVLGEQLRAPVVAYAEVESGPDSDYYVVTRGHFAPGAPNLIGRHRANDFGKTLFDETRAGRTVSIADVTTDPRITERERAAYAVLTIRAFVVVPLLKRGRHVALIVALGPTERAWTPEEIALVQETGERTWAAVERARVEKELRDREEQLVDGDRRKDEFLAVLAHELRNPLAPIRAGLELLRLSGDTEAAVARVRAMMERQVGHMVRLIDDLLDVARISTGKIRLQRTPTPLAGMIDTAVEANREALTVRSTELSVELPGDPVVLDVDPTRFVQVVSNLLHNAVKFAEPAGRVRVAAAARAETGELVLTVTDSGVGIAPEVLPRVFDLFAQGMPASPGSQAGLGIGLALSRRLVEMHGGTIDAMSDGRGRGSTFTIRIPGAVISPVVAAPETPPRPREITHRVLVIDDNRDAADLTAMLVSELGGESAVAYDGESGLAGMDRFHPDVVLLDLGMPGIDGYETCRRIRHKYGTGLRVIALTGWAQEQDKNRAILAGFDAHLTKPIDPAALGHLLAHS